MALPIVTPCPKCGEPGGRGYCSKCHGPRDQFESAIVELRERVGVGRCPICKAHADAEHSTLAFGGQVLAGCENGHRWAVRFS
jgi:hypothetical protein